MARRFSLRRMLRFSLRTLLLAVTALSVALAWWSNGARAQRQSVAELEKYNQRGRYKYNIPRKESAGVALPFALLSDEPEEEDPWVPRFIYDALGKDYFYAVTEVEIAAPKADEWQGNPNDRAWLALRGLSGLQRLTSYSSASAEGVALLPSLPRLKEITFYNTGMNDQTLALLVECDELTRIAFSTGQVSPNGLAQLKKVRQLRTLSLDVRHEYFGLELPCITDEHLSAVAGIRTLKELSVSANSATDAGLAQIGALTNLCTLSLRANYMTGSGLRGWAEMTSLETLHLVMPNLKDEQLAWLAHLPRLSRLQLYRSKVTAEGLQQLGGAPQLRDLIVRPTPPGDIKALKAALPSCQVHAS